MVYRGLDIGTAKPGKSLLEQFPHALIDIREPEESFSVQAFCGEADAAVHSALADDRLPVLVGGSMMYFRAFREGLAELPTADEAIRKEIRALADKKGLDAVHNELRRVDPVGAREIDPRNLKRIERALEVYRLTGKPISELWKERAVPDATKRLNCELIEFSMPAMPRSDLHEKIESRLREMFNSGFIDEVRALRTRPNLTRDSLSMRTVGYREIWTHLDERDGEVEEEALFQSVLVATRRLARRQLTWLRGWKHVDFTIADSVEVMIERLKL